MTGLQSDGLTAEQLKQHVENWMSKLQVTVKYDPSEAVKQLENLGLLMTKLTGTNHKSHHNCNILLALGYIFVQVYK